MVGIVICEKLKCCLFTCYTIRINIFTEFIGDSLQVYTLQITTTVTINRVMKSVSHFKNSKWVAKWLLLNVNLVLWFSIPVVFFHLNVLVRNPQITR